MKTKNMIAAWRTLLAVSLVAALPLAVEAGKPGGSTSSVPLQAHIFTQVLDEQSTTGYYNNGTEFCSGNVLPTDVSGLLPDSAPGPTTAWTSGFPWTALAGFTSATYDNGAQCLTTGACLRTEFNTSDKNFTLDTRTTLPQRTITVDFSDPYQNAIPLGLPTPLTTPGLFQLLGTSAFTSMGVCSSRACPEAKLVAAKFWFNDPVTPDVQWRVDWRSIRVLRVTATTWHFIADACDGTLIAGLSKLEGNRTKPRESNQGRYLIPLFVVVDKK
jgi:hypothetical protein